MTDIAADHTVGARKPDGDQPARLRILAAGVTLVFLWALAVITLTDVFDASRWVVAALTICSSTLLVACLVRALSWNSRALACISGGLSGVLCWGYWLWESGRAAAWWREPQIMLADASTLVADGYAPLDPSGPLEDLVLLVILLGVMATTLLLAGAGLPFGAGVCASLVMLIPHAVIGVRMDSAILILAGLALALLAWMGSPVADLLSAGAAALAVALAAVAVALAPPVRDTVWNESVVPSAVSTSVPDVTITLANDLRYRSNSPAFTFSSEVAGPQRFTLATLTDFTGGRWLPENSLDSDGVTVTSPRSPLPLRPTQADPAPPTVAVSVTIDGLVSEWLPLPEAATAVSSTESQFEPDQWRWAESSATARSEAAVTRRNDQYTAFSVPRIPEDLIPGVAERLPTEATRLITDPGEAADEFAPYLQLPGGVPSAITDAAVHVASAAQDRLAVGYALQEWFRSGEFVYDESAPYSPGMDRDNPYHVMEALLIDKRGFCVHYASTFAVMARTLGVPTRINVGYATYSDGAGDTVVRGRELHAWPEIYVNDAGWVAFEPTPGGAGVRSTSGASEAALEEPSPAEQTDQADEPPESPDPLEPTNEDQPDGVVESEEPAGSDSTLGRVWSAGIAVVLLGAALLLVPSFIRRTRTVRRNAAAARGVRPAQNAWNELRDTALDLGLTGTVEGPLPRAHTAEALVDHLVRSGVLIDDSAVAARQLADMMTAERYGGRTVANYRQTTQLLSTARSAMWASVPRRVRLHASLKPRSVWGHRAPGGSHSTDDQEMTRSDRSDQHA